MAVSVVLALTSMGVRAADCAITATCVSAVQSSEANVISTIGGQILKVGQNILSGLEQATSTQMKHDTEVADAKNQKEIENQRNAKKYESVKNSAPTSAECMTRGIAAISGGVNAHTAASIKNYALYHKLLAARSSGGGSSSSSMVDNHRDNYCNKDVDPNCSKAAKSNEYGNPMTDADSDVGSVLSGAGGNGNGSRVFTPEQTKAALSYTENSTGGAYIPRRLTKAEADTPKGKIYEAARIEYEAQISANQAGMHTIIASQQPIEGSQEIVSQLKKSVKGSKSEKWLLQELGKLDSNPSPIRGKLSYAELMRLESGRRFSNAGWYEDIQSSDDTTLLREIAHMLATSIYMQYQQSVRDETRLAAESVASTTANKASMQKLKELDDSIYGVNHQ